MIWVAGSRPALTSHERELLDLVVTQIEPSESRQLVQTLWYLRQLVPGQVDVCNSMDSKWPLD